MLQKVKEDSTGENNADQGDMEDEPHSEIPISPQEVSQPNEDAVRSDIKSMRQTAVSMTVGEKESASALIKDWLADNPNKEDAPAEEAGEE